MICVYSIRPLTHQNLSFLHTLVFCSTPREHPFAEAKHTDIKPTTSLLCLYVYEFTLFGADVPIPTLRKIVTSAKAGAEHRHSVGVLAAITLLNGSNFVAKSIIAANQYGSKPLTCVVSFGATKKAPQTCELKTSWQIAELACWLPHDSRTHFNIELCLDGEYGDAYTRLMEHIREQISCSLRRFLFDRGWKRDILRRELRLLERGSPRA